MVGPHDERDILETIEVLMKWNISRRSVTAKGNDSPYKNDVY